MDPKIKEKIEQRRKAIYLAVKTHRPDLYRRAVEVAHLSMPEFGGNDPVKRAAGVENAVMSLVAEAAEIEV